MSEGRLQRLDARVLCEGEASGEIFATQPLSFWGGYEAATGRVSDVSHPAHGHVLAGMVLVMRSGRGSSSASSVLAEAIRLGTAPVALVLSEPDSILCVGAMVAAALYQRHCPIVVVSPEALATLSACSGQIRVVAQGESGAVYYPLRS